MFSFSGEESFCKKYTYFNTLIHYQDDDGTLTEDELIKKLEMPYYLMEMDVAKGIYKELKEKQEN